MFRRFGEFSRGDKDYGEETRSAVVFVGWGGEGEDCVEDGEEEGEGFAGAGLGAEEGVVVWGVDEVVDCEGLDLCWFGDLEGALEVGAYCWIYPQEGEFGDLYQLSICGI